MRGVPCRSYCPHGGICNADEAGHTGPHSSGYCDWTDAQALDKAAADALYRADNPWADAAIAMEDFLYDVLAMLENAEKENPS